MNESIMNSYAFDFAIKRSCERRSNALERFVKIDPIYLDYQLPISTFQALSKDTAKTFPKTAMKL